MSALRAHELAHVTGEQGRAGHLRQHQMETRRHGGYIPGGPRVGALLRLDLRVQPLDLRRRELAAEAAHHKLLHILPDTEQIPRLLKAGLGDARPRLGRISTSSSLASNSSARRTTVRLAPNCSPMASSGSLVPGWSTCSRMARRRPA